MTTSMSYSNVKFRKVKLTLLNEIKIKPPSLQLATRREPIYRRRRQSSSPIVAKSTSARAGEEDSTYAGCTRSRHGAQREWVKSESLSTVYIHAEIRSFPRAELRLAYARNTHTHTHAHMSNSNQRGANTRGARKYVVGAPSCIRARKKRESANEGCHASRDNFLCRCYR